WPVIGGLPKMFLSLVVVIGGILAVIVVPEVSRIKTVGVAGGAVLLESGWALRRDMLPNGMLGVAIAGLLASFMAGMAANISAFNTVFSYDLWQQYAVKNRPDDYYTRVGRVATVGATIIAIGTATFASQYGNLMDYLQTLF